MTNDDYYIRPAKAMDILEYLAASLVRQSRAKGDSTLGDADDMTYQALLMGITAILFFDDGEFETLYDRFMSYYVILTREVMKKVKEAQNDKN